VKLPFTDGPHASIAALGLIYKEYEHAVLRISGSYPFTKELMVF
jgi:hypothetical protein